MSAHDPRADAYAAGITGLVDAHVAARVLGGPPSWRAPSRIEHHPPVVGCGGCGGMRGVCALDALSGVTCVSGAFEAVRSVRAYRLARRRYLDAVREVADAYARLHGQGGAS